MLFRSYNKLTKEKGINLIFRKAILGIEYGLTLLRLNKILRARVILDKSIKTILCIDEKSADLFYNFVYVAESKIRLHNFAEAYKDCVSALQFYDKSNHNYKNLINGYRIYHMSIIKYKQKDYELSLKHFSDFFAHMNVFCKGFLDKSVYEKLLKDGVFKIIKDHKDIQKCLDNSLKIFIAIYGENHSFVKDYVAENCKNHSWICEKMKIIWYYFQLS